MNILIIGASRGIGYEFARQHHEAGDTVYASARGQTGIARLKDLGVNTLVVNTADALGCSGLSWGIDGTRFDRIWHVAGVFGPRTAGVDTPVQQDFDLVMHTNVLGFMRLAPQYLDALAPGGRIGVLSSKMGSIGLRTSPSGWTYRASKAAVNSVVKDASLVLGNRGLVAAFHPGWVQTDMGGTGADIPVERSVADLRRTMDALKPSDTGGFFNHDGYASGMVSSTLRVHLGLCGMTLLWGLSWPAGRAIAQTLPLLSSSAWRFSLAALVLVTWARVARGGWPQLSARQWAGLAAAGSVGVFGYTIFFMYGMSHVEASRAAVVVTTNPVFVTLAAAWLFGEPFNWRIGAGLSLAVLGAATVMTHGQPWALLTGGVGVGEWLLVGCIVSWAGYSLMAKRLMVGVDSLTATAMSAAFGCVLLWLAALVVDGPAVALTGLPEVTPGQGGLLVFMALGPTVLSYVWFFRGISALGAGVASSYISLVPVVGVSSAVLLLGEPLGWSLAVGGAMALTGVVMANRARR